MKTRFLRICIVLTATVLVGLRVPAKAEDLDNWISERMAQSRVPGLAAAIVRDGNVIWSQGWGLRDVDGALPVSAATPFGQASVSKVVTATALMALLDQGAFSLDDAIDPWLPFPVKNPSHGSRSITFRHLLTHSSSIADNWDVLDFLVVDGDSPIALGSFLRGYLAPGGAWYDPRRNFSLGRPGQRIEYSNVGIALVGYLVERISGMPFDEYSERHIFTPLGMLETAWKLSDLSVHEIAKPYQWRPGLGRFSVLAHYGYPDYPDGQLRSSARDMARLLALYANGGELDGFRLLGDGTLTEMLRVQFPSLDPTQGLVLGWTTIGGRQVIGHDGGDWGIYSEFYFEPATGIGVVLLSNAEPAEGDMLDVVARLFEEAEAFVGSTCEPSAERLCLNSRRFGVEVQWKGHQSPPAQGQVVQPSPPSSDTGIFWFFSEANWELMVKVLDGCTTNGHYWVFAAALTDVEYTMTVRDSLTGEVRTYFNALGVSAPAITDTGAFDSCP